MKITIHNHNLKGNWAQGRDPQQLKWQREDLVYVLEEVNQKEYSTITEFNDLLAQELKRQSIPNYTFDLLAELFEIEISH